MVVAFLIFPIFFPGLSLTPVHKKSFFSPDHIISPDPKWNPDPNLNPEPKCSFSPDHNFRPDHISPLPEPRCIPDPKCSLSPDHNFRTDRISFLPDHNFKPDHISPLSQPRRVPVYVPDRFIFSCHPCFSPPILHAAFACCTTSVEIQTRAIAQIIIFLFMVFL
jgi:hypothetical protein